MASISKNTIKMRLRSGMTREQAENTPLKWKRKLTIDKVLEVREHGLGINRTAALLDVTNATLSRFLKNHEIDWPNKGKQFKKGELKPNSLRAKCERAGVKKVTVEKQMLRHSISMDEAISRVLVNKAKKEAKK